MSNRPLTTDERVAWDAILERLREGPLPYDSVIETAQHAAVKAGGRHLVTAAGQVRPVHMERFIRLMRSKLSGIVLTRGRGGKRHTCEWRLA